VEAWASSFSFFAIMGFARRDYPNNQPLALLADDTHRSRFAISYTERNVWRRVSVDDIRHVRQPHAAITREHLQTEQGCFRRKPGNRGWTAIPAQGEVVKVEMSYISVNGDAIQPCFPSLQSKVASLGESLVEDDPIKGSRRRSAKTLSRQQRQ
jgi:hypothetical protein